MRARTVLIAALLALGILASAVLIFSEILKGDRRGRLFPEEETAAAGGPTRGGGPGRDGGPRGSEGRGDPRHPSEDRSSAGSPGGGPRGDGGTDGAHPGEPGPGPASSSPAAGADRTGAGTAAQPLGKGDATIAVIVTDPDGRPFAGVEVEIRGGQGARAAATDTTGSAEMKEIPAGDYDVLVRAPGSVPLRSTRAVEVASGERLEVRFQVPASDAEITGRVLDSAGEPVAGIEIEARPLAFPGTAVKFTADAPPPAPLSSGPDGTFRFTGLPRVEHTLSTRETPRFPPARATAIAGSAEPVDITVNERRTLRIEGTVFDRDGNPVPEVQITALTHPANPARTDPEGLFHLEVKYERGAVALAAKKTGYAQGEAVLSAAEIGVQEEVDMSFTIEPIGKTGELKGRITDPQGKAVPRQVVHLQSSSLNANYQGTSGQDGEFGIREIRIAPDYRIWVNPDRGYRDFAQGPFEVTEGSSRLDIVLTPLGTGRLTGRMVDPAGRPVPRLTLWVRSIEESANTVPVTGDEQGRFTAEDVPAGDLRFETRAAPHISVQGIRLEEGESRDVELLVGLGQGRLSGLVTTPDGKDPIAGAKLALSWSGSRGSLQSSVYREATSDAQGRFTFSGLSKGRGSLVASAPGFQEHRETRELTGESDEIRVSMAEPAR